MVGLYEDILFVIPAKKSKHYYRYSIIHLDIFAARYILVIVL